MNRVLRLAIMAVMLLATACGGDTPSPTPPAPQPGELHKNSYSIDGEVYTFESVALTNINEYLCVVASPDVGIESFDSFFEEGHQYLYIAISPLLEGEEFSLKEESRLYTVMSTLAGALLTEVTPTSNLEIESAHCTFSYEEGVATIDLRATLEDGTELKALIEAEQHLTINENVITRNGEQKPVRASFYTTDEGMTMLYLTPAGVDYFDEMTEMASWYVYLIVDDALCDGGNVDITATSNHFMAGLVDNGNESLSIAISQDNLQGASGSFSVKSLSGQGEYRITADIQWGAESLTINFEGEMKDATVVEQRSNVIIVDGAQHMISSATLDRTDEEVWSLTLNSKGHQLTLTMPAEFFDGRAVGFSTDSRVKATYNSLEMNKAGGYTGTIFITLDGDSVEAEFMNNSEVGAYYKGKYTE